jgi:3-oxoacyl-(acyl-carrier-protein) synthase
MKFKLIYPKWEKLERQTRFTLPPHGPVVFAATIPDDVDVEFIDENTQPVDFEQPADFVGISVMLTSQIKRGWEIADTYREKGVKVIFGGIATMLHAEETEQHADAAIGAHEISAISAAANDGSILDRMEAGAYAAEFAANGLKPAITSLKGALGESFSGGGIRACALALSVEEGALPPTVGFGQPLRPLAFVQGEKKVMNINNALLTGISFGGTYACLVFGDGSDSGGL